MQQATGEPPGRIAPADELVNTPEFEAMARRKLDSVTFASIAGGDRKAFDRITLRPRMMVNTTKLDLSASLFGAHMFTPILVAPLSHQKRFHPEGEIATARGAAAAKAVMTIADRSDFPLDQIAAQAKTGWWYQLAPDPNVEAARELVRKAAAAGCGAVCLNAGGWDWAAIDKFRAGMNVPLVLKGIMSPDEGNAAVRHGIQGVIVSNYQEGADVAGLAPTIEVLPGIVDALAGKAAVLIDGGFRRGSDILMALALGANAVMIGRPVLWGLAAYGTDGVQHVIEMLQSELARDMAMCGRVDLKSLDRTAVKIHRW